MPAAANVRQYADIVRETSVLRQLINVGNEIAELGYEHPDEARVLLDTCEQKVFAISQHRTSADFDAMGDLIKSTFERIDLIREGLQLSGIPSGFADIDKTTGGFQPSNLIVLAARPGVGKTSLALNIAHNVGLTGQASVAIFSLEMSKQEISERMLCSAARVASHRLRSGQTLLAKGQSVAPTEQGAGAEAASQAVSDSSGAGGS